MLPLRLSLRRIHRKPCIRFFWDLDSTLLVVVR